MKKGQRNGRHAAGAELSSLEGSCSNRGNALHRQRMPTAPPRITSITNGHDLPGPTLPVNTPAMTPTTTLQ